MKRKILALLCAATVVIGCSIDNECETGAGTPNAVKIAAMIKSRATELDFEDGDKIGLTIKMDADAAVYADNSELTYAGGSFSSSLLWYDDIDLASTLIAYYPYIDGDSAPISFTIQSDQTTSNAYTVSDLMGVVKAGVKPDETTYMTFSHLLSRVVTEVDNQCIYDVVSVEISGSYPTATFDAAIPSVEVDQTAETISIKAPLWDDGSYKAIIIPQTVALTFNVALSDGSVVSCDKAAMTFAAGGEYTAKITLKGGDVEVDISGDIKEWTDGGTIPDAESNTALSFTESEDEFTYDGETYNLVTLSNGSKWMAEPLRYVPSGLTGV